MINGTYCRCGKRTSKTIAGRVRTVTWRNNSYPTGLGKHGLQVPHLPTNHKNCVLFNVIKNFDYTKVVDRLETSN